MLKRKKTTPPRSSGETIIGQGTEIKGSIVADGLMRIDGKFEGTIETEGDLVVGNTGVVDAQIQAGNLMVAGEVRGKIAQVGRLEIGRSGKLFADAKVEQLVIEQGALFQGQCLMDNAPKEVAEQKKSREELFSELEAVEE